MFWRTAGGVSINVRFWYSSGTSGSTGGVGMVTKNIEKFKMAAPVVTLPGSCPVCI